jgi:hypothetical protein
MKCCKDYTKLTSFGLDNIPYAEKDISHPLEGIDSKKA